uniref:hypothetical protein n=1 Tax=Streptomyces natalensis TaxID=68242 RepID=UPI001868A38D|nr:hypothetical protein [Streptomyces natalensis]
MRALVAVRLGDGAGGLDDLVEGDLVLLVLVLVGGRVRGGRCGLGEVDGWAGRPARWGRGGASIRAAPHQPIMAAGIAICGMVCATFTPA